MLSGSVIMRTVSGYIFVSQYMHGEYLRKEFILIPFSNILSITSVEKKNTQKKF